MAKATRKAKVTGSRILDAALDLFRTKGFDDTTMRDVAVKAGVANGAAYYYYPSKDAIVRAFYQRLFDEMLPKIQEVLDGPGSLEGRMREVIRVKLQHLTPNRVALRGMLRNGADPTHPISPFSPENKEFREVEIGWFRRLLADEGVRVPSEFEAYVPEVLWSLHVGIVFFWIADDSSGQANTMRLLDQGMNTVTALLRAYIPLPAIGEAS